MGAASIIENMHRPKKSTKKVVKTRSKVKDVSISNDEKVSNKKGEINAPTEDEIIVSNDVIFDVSSTDNEEERELAPDLEPDPDRPIHTRAQ